MKTVLFACGENKKRSQMAEAIFNHFANDSNALSGGTSPAEAVDPVAILVLKEHGIIINGNIKPKKVSNGVLKEADLIISFGCLVRAMFPQEKFLEWHIKDPQTLEEFREVYNILNDKIKDLIAQYSL